MITAKIHTSKLLISKLIVTVSRFRIRVVALDIIIIHSLVICTTQNYNLFQVSEIEVYPLSNKCPPPSPV